MSPPYQLAQINVAHAVDDLESATLAGFVNRLDEINQIADASAGFVYRINPREDANYEPGHTDPRVVVNLSVWESVETLKDFVYHTVHLDLIQQKAQWFKPLDTAHMALWWVPAGTQPTEKDGLERLNHLRKNGPSEFAFSIARPLPKPAMPPRAT